MYHLTVGDLHLYDREMRSTRGMVKNSRVILDNLYQYLKENEDIVLLNINGDIQHRTPVNKYNRREIAYWRKMFRKIGELMTGRFKRIKGFKLVGVGKDVEDGFKRGNIAPIFVTRGNHDSDSELRYTFFDDLVDEGLVVHAEGLLVLTDKGRTYFSYRDYEVKRRRVPNFKRKTDVIALEHNDILHVESELWNIPDAENKFLSVEDVIEGVDVVILHHIHTSIDPLKVGSGDKGAVLWQVGSLARTALIDEAKRNVGYGALMKFGDVERFKRIEIPLMPYMEYFSYEKEMRKRKYENNFKDFSLQIGEQKYEVVDYKDDIRKFEGVDDEVKEYAIQVMDDIRDKGEK